MTIKVPAALTYDPCDPGWHELLRLTVRWFEKCGYPNTDALDLSQDALLRLIQLAHRDKLIEDLKRLTPKIARGIVVDCLRARELQRKKVATLLDPDCVPEKPRLSRLTDEDNAQINLEINGLSEIQRAAVIGVYWDGRTREEIAEAFGTTPGRIHRQLQDARELLRDRLAPFGEMLFPDNSRANGTVHPVYKATRTDTPNSLAATTSNT